MIQKLQKWKEQNLDWKGILKIKLKFDTKKNIIKFIKIYKFKENKRG